MNSVQGEQTEVRPTDHPPVFRRGPRSERTGERLLEAGRKMLLQHGMTSSLPVRISDVVSSIGMTTGAAYQLWSSQDVYQQALTAHMLAPSFWVEPTAVIAGIRNDFGRDTFNQMVRRSCLGLLRCLVNQPTYYVNLHFYAVAFHQEALRATLREGYEPFRDEYVALFVDMLAKFGQRVRAEYSTDDLVTTLAAMAEGFAIRALIDSARTQQVLEIDNIDGQWSLFLSAATSIVEGFTEPR